MQTTPQIQQHDFAGTALGVELRFDRMGYEMRFQEINRAATLKVQDRGKVVFNSKTPHILVKISLIDGYKALKLEFGIGFGKRRA